VEGPATRSYPTVSATILAEVFDALGAGRRSRREAWSVGLVMVCAGLLGVGALVLALIG